jgi:hypothetical protein
MKEYGSSAVHAALNIGLGARKLAEIMGEKAGRVRDHVNYRRSADFDSRAVRALRAYVTTVATVATQVAELEVQLIANDVPLETTKQPSPKAKANGCSVLRFRFMLGLALGAI